MLDDYVDKELVRRERIVIENPDWLVVVPYWAAWPFETMIISRKKLKRIDELNDTQKQNLSIVIKQLTTKYDNLFKCSFPYSMGFHGMSLVFFLHFSSSNLQIHVFATQTIFFPMTFRCPDWCGIHW